MKSSSHRRLGCVQLWMSGYAAGFGLAAMVPPAYLLALALFMLSHQNMMRAKRIDAEVAR